MVKDELSVLAAFLTVLVIVLLDSYEPTQWLADLMSGAELDPAEVAAAAVPAAVVSEVSVAPAPAAVVPEAATPTPVASDASSQADALTRAGRHN